MSTDEQQEQTQEERGTSLLMDVSNTMVRIYKEQFGRGPTRARSNWAGPDALICVLEETLTPTERNLVKLGEHQRLRDTRMFFQHARVRGFCEPVERITGRKVRAFQSSIDTGRRAGRRGVRLPSRRLRTGRRTSTGHSR